VLRGARRDRGVAQGPDVTQDSAGLAEPVPTLKKGKEYLIVRQNQGTIRTAVAALAIAAGHSLGQPPRRSRKTWKRRSSDLTGAPSLLRSAKRSQSLQRLMTWPPAASDIQSAEYNLQRPAPS
jgi:hypothetical protein